MEKAKLEAHYENRVYYFRTTFKSLDKISINMYSTDYSFVLKEGNWENTLSNKNSMVQGLIDAVIKAAENE